MAWRSGASLSRTLLSAARTPALRPSAPLPRLRPPTTSSALPSVQPRRLPFTSPRNLNALGCASSFLPLYSVAAAGHLTSHLNANVRAFCELSHGTFCRTCQDR